MGPLRRGIPGRGTSVVPPSTIDLALGFEHWPSLGTCTARGAAGPGGRRERRWVQGPANGGSRGGAGS